MTLQKLAEAFSDWEYLPVEINDVRNVILDMGVQEKIIYSPQPIDITELRGAYYRYKTRNSLYGDVERVSLIVYSDQQDKYWQRLVCCKETIHIFDDIAHRTNTREEVVSLAEKLMETGAADSHGLADIMAITDRLALYQAICVLFPDPAREVAIKSLASREGTIQQISEWAQLPIEFTDLVLSKDWPEIRSIVLDC